VAFTIVQVAVAAALTIVSFVVIMVTVFFTASLHDGERREKGNNSDRQEHALVVVGLEHPDSHDYSPYLFARPVVSAVSRFLFWALDVAP
jgi:hypothetical protein